MRPDIYLTVAEQIINQTQTETKNLLSPTFSSFFLEGFGVINSLTETVIDVTFRPHRCQTVDTKFEVISKLNISCNRQ